MEKRGFWNAVFTLIGVTVGAGILGIPYAVAKAGFWTGIVVMILVGLMMGFVSLCLAELVLRTKGRHQISGLANKYLGSKGKYLIFFTLFFSLYGALFAYILGSGQLLSNLLGVSGKVGSWLFFLVLAIVLFFDLRFFARVESILTPLKILLVLLLSVLMIPFVEITNLTGFSMKNFLIPYGIILFAFLGISAIPEMALEIEEKKKFKKAVIYGVVISGLVYLLYTFVFIGSFGSTQPELSILSLTTLSAFLFILGNLFALLALITAFIVLGFALKDNFILDFKQNKHLSWVYVVVVPVILLLFNISGFVNVLEFTATLGGGLLLISILVMHSLAKKEGSRNPEFSIKEHRLLKILISLLIIVGIVYELFL